MKVVSILLVAFVVGLVHTFIKPYLEGLVPDSLKSNWVVSTLITGGFIILALLITTTALKAVGLAPRKAVV